MRLKTVKDHLGNPIGEPIGSFTKPGLPDESVKL
ncbi:MAG: hypothetical protein RLZZ571_446, partial [Actinomycetota bacterium]